jgi:hypothetical protein
VPFPAVAAEARRGERQQRAQALAAGRDDVRRELRDERDRALHPIHDQAVAGLEVGAHERGQRVQRIFGAGRRRGHRRHDRRGFRHRIGIHVA